MMNMKSCLSQIPKAMPKEVRLHDFWRKQRQHQQWETQRQGELDRQSAEKLMEQYTTVSNNS
eukprot:scaffold55786_cov19-Prasinocladus_malaysianus.AAC.1